MSFCGFVGPLLSPTSSRPDNSKQIVEQTHKQAIIITIILETAERHTNSRRSSHSQAIKLKLASSHHRGSRFCSTVVPVVEEASARGQSVMIFMTRLWVCAASVALPTAPAPEMQDKWQQVADPLDVSLFHPVLLRCSSGSKATVSWRQFDLMAAPGCRNLLWHSIVYKVPFKGLISRTYHGADLFRDSPSQR